MAIETATLAAGCFWGVEYHLKKLKGVKKTLAGYTGGNSDSKPTYQEVCRGTTGHAEAVQVEFDSNEVSFLEILNLFWRLHDPTQLNRQGPDIGTQYRSAIFYHSEQQLSEAKESKKNFDESGVFPTPAVTTLEPASAFFPAEEFHQDYFS